MSDEPRGDVDLTDDERRALAGLRDGPTPPAALEDRVVGDLRRRGLVASGTGEARRPGPAGWWRLAAAAALVAGFVLGFGTGRWSGGATVPGGPAGPGGSGAAAGSPAGPGERYLLLLYEVPEQLRVPEEERARLVAEYGAWAAEQRRAGSLVGGEKLAGDGLVLVADEGLPVTREPGAGTSRTLSGFFLVEAGSYEEARRIAESCPHLDHGGEIEIRRIEET